MFNILRCSRRYNSTSASMMRRPVVQPLKVFVKFCKAQAHLHCSLHRWEIFDTVTVMKPGLWLQLCD